MREECLKSRDLLNDECKYANPSAGVHDSRFYYTLKNAVKILNESHKFIAKMEERQERGKTISESDLNNMLTKLHKAVHYVHNIHLNINHNDRDKYCPNCPYVRLYLTKTASITEYKYYGDRFINDSSESRLCSIL